MTLSQDVVFVGVDVGKADLFLAVHGASGAARYSNDTERIAALVGDLPTGAVVGFEATGGYEYALWAAMADAGVPARQLPPAHTKAHEL